MIESTRGLLYRLCLIEFLHFVAWQASSTILPQHLAAMGYDSLAVGLIVAAFGIPAAVLGLGAGMAADQWGPRHAQRAGLLAMTLGATLLALSHRSALGMVGAQVIMGLSQMFILVATQSWIAANVPAARSQQTFGWLAFASGLGWMVGPLLGGYLAERSGFPMTLAVAAGLHLLPLCVSLSIRYRSEEHRPRTSVFWLRNVAPLSRTRTIVSEPTAAAALLVSFGAMFGYSLRDAILPLFLVSRGFSPTEIGLALGAMAGASVGIRPFLGIIGDRAWRVLTGIIALAAFGLAVLPFWSPTAWLVAVILGIGFVVGISNPMTIAIMSFYTPPESRGVALSLRFVVNRIAQLSNPLFLGGIAAVAGLHVTFMLPAMLLGTLAAAMTRLQPPYFGDVQPAKSQTRSLHL